MSSASFITLGLIAVPIIAIIIVFNKLISLRNRFKNAFAQIDVQLTRRYELIPNLVETAKQYMQHEREALQGVIEARNHAASAAKAAGSNPDQSAAIKALIGAEASLGAHLGGLFALAENYPELQANETMMQLMEALTSTENKVAFARQAYNDSVMSYNIYREQFPSNIIANFFRFLAAELFVVETEEHREAVQIKFN